MWVVSTEMFCEPVSCMVCVCVSRTEETHNVSSPSSSTPSPVELSDGNLHPLYVHVRCTLVLSVAEAFHITFN